MTEHSKIKIAIASGKGGTGKTFISTNLFWAAQNSGITTTLVDCDAEEPNDCQFIPGYILNNKVVTQKTPVIDSVKCTFCGKCFDYCNYNAIIFLPQSNYIQVVEDLCHDCGACMVACDFKAISEKEKPIGTVKQMYVTICAELIVAETIPGVHSPVPVIKKAIQHANHNHLVILDSPPGISCPFIASVEKADYVVLVTEPTPFGLNDLKLSAETLQKIGKPFGVVVNRAGLGSNSVFNWLNENHIPLLMEIPFDKEIARIYSDGKLLVETEPRYYEKFLRLLRTIYKKIDE
ncbi:MAG TPA: ATP-binding protein [Prolixibacteraceae bacterium]|nr:ATP-binding protein [Prolixibacteraceae bacterium]